MLLKLCLVSAIILIVNAKNEEHKGFRIYNVKFETQEQQDRFDELKNDVIDYLRQPSLKHGILGRAMLPQSEFSWFEEKLEELGIEKVVAVEDVYEYLAEIEATTVRTKRSVDERVFDFDGYYTYDEILTYMRLLAETHTDATTTVTLEEFGQTDLERPLVYLKISRNLPIEVERPVVIVEACVNPREWITVPSALNIVTRVLENQNQVLDKADWIVAPVLNPDGYEYTRTNIRLWTKNRSTRGLGFICPGANINRNFNVSWGVSDSSTTPCSHNYAGVAPYSEPETRFIQYLIEEYGRRTKLYISLQNNGGFVSYPWQFERAASGMFRQHHLLGLDMVAAMSDEYRLDIGWSALGDRASGTSSDFVQKSGVLYTFNIDAVQRGADGVNIPEAEIRDVIEDVWRGVAVAADAIL